MITILSIDGGGIRGLIPAMVMAELENWTGKPICQLFDVIAGTSTGGILAAMLTVPDKNGNPKYTAADAVNLYTDLGKSVFHRSLWHRIITLGGLTGPKYSCRKLEQYLKDYLGDQPLHSTLTNVLIPAYETLSNTPWFFKSPFAAANRGSRDDPPLASVVHSTSASPIFFPPNKIGRRCFVDGGIFANNPTLCAYAEVKKRFPNEDKILIVSLGTGLHMVPYPYKKIKNWGSLQWIFPIFNLFQNSADGTVDYQMKALIGNSRYFRFQVKLDDQTDDMDDASDQNLKRLTAIAQKEINKNRLALSEISQTLKIHASHR